MCSDRLIVGDQELQWPFPLGFPKGEARLKGPPEGGFQERLSPGRGTCHSKALKTAGNLPETSQRANATERKFMVKFGLGRSHL